MSTLILTDPAFLRHNPGAGHPERPERLESILKALSRTPIVGVVERTPRIATPAELAAVHSAALLEMLKTVEGHSARIDPDTAMSPESYRAAILAAGAAVEAVEEVMAGRATNSFALVRPPGHHAEPGRAMGFCLLNNAAIAAEAARRHGAERVLVLDWDVHHGNGTQASFYNRCDVLYQSVHQFPFYPGTGNFDEIGDGAGRGFTVNCPLPGGQLDADYGLVFEELLLPVAREFRPSVVIVSAGFDPHEEDPLGGMRVTERGFAAMCSTVKQLADECCGGKLVLLLEGGYSLAGLSNSVHACLEVLAGRRDEFPTGAQGTTAAAVRTVKSTLGTHWKSLRSKT